MDVNAIIQPLNTMQRQAVSAPMQAMLVLAGAGSGKTRVLVHRIAWLMQVENLAPQQILAVTFTNKAAKEMRSRIEDLFDMSIGGMWIGTFHGLAHRLLRQHTHQAKLPETFQVMDSDDQLRMIKRLSKTMGIDDSRWPPKKLQGFINAQKDEGIRATHISPTGDIYLQQQIELYLAYEQNCQRSGLVDFAELLLRAHELLRDNAELLHFYRQRFQQVHVDEFQDTNSIQYAWLRLLTEGHNNLFVVGDDDQSIYGWRGAKIENIFNFQQHYPQHQMIRLEQNYRSTGHILTAANALIANNQQRLGKNLWTATGNGEPISLYAAFNEQDEAYFVVEKIRQWVSEGHNRADTAILYRSNAQSRLFEEKLMITGTPYRVYGGLRFFERTEIKNVLAYLRLISNRNDDAAFERIINTPTRGIGQRSVDTIRSKARDENLSLWQAAVTLIQDKALNARASNAINSFLHLISLSAQAIEEQPLEAQVLTVLENSGLIGFYQQEKTDKGEARIENLKELVSAAKQFDVQYSELPNMSDLDNFLAHAALEAGEMQGESHEDCVQLMTLHAAKGLEFKQVFIVGIEEGLFPSHSSVDDVARLAEERRLCYVGITRAMQSLYLCYAESRRLYGKETYPKPSRFIKEIPQEQLQEVRIRAAIVQPVAKKTSRKSAVQTGRYYGGQKVHHAKFGEGVVLQTQGAGKEEKVEINFRGVGIKWLMTALAKLDKR